MIQRTQSIWLLLAGILAALSFKFTFYSGNFLMNEQLQLCNLDSFGIRSTAAGSSTEFNIISTLLIAAVAVLSIASVFFYSNRRSQFKWTVITFLLSLVAVAYMIYQTTLFSGGTYSLTSAMLFVIPVLLFLAARSIRNDEKLVRSMDRLR